MYMWRRGWIDPFEELRRTVERLNRMLFEGFEPLREFRETISVDIIDEGDKIRVLADLPGFKKEEIELFFEGGNLVIKAESKEESEEKGRDFIRRERRYGRVYRKVALPEGLKIEATKASYKNGVLEIEIPKEKVEKRIIPLE
ncbi:MAG: Hsp20/alpha crystallin family protein [Archaeoglobaceae archaeon]|nr:Hsp20/alpha crystallin family protein [Archaeoglobaceae archaeon]MDW7989341.1 Hsp20/alpha crystallin family protein [Archaeoglobaceae archaeon]